MPKCLDPNAVNEIHLASDAHLAAESRPTFLARFISCATFNEICDLIDRLEGAKMTAAEVNDHIFGWLDKCIVGWRKMIDQDGKAIEFNGDALRGILTFNEGVELLMLIAGFAPRSVDIMTPAAAQG